MRAFLAVTAAAIAAQILPSVAADRCLARVRQGAQPYIQKGDFGPMLPATVDASTDRPAITDEVAQIDRFTSGGPWIALRRAPYYYRQVDAELSGDCTHLPNN